MAKSKSLYICSVCGYESPKWFGCCPGCREWNTMNEEIVSQTAAAKSKTSRPVQSLRLDEINSESGTRYQTGMKELDRVLGGGLVKGSLVLLSGDPGIGKSTILLQVCQYLSRDLEILYISGEESAHQIKLRAHRLGVDNPKLRIMSETDVLSIVDYIRTEKPDVVIVDSIQTMDYADVSSSPGSVTQVRECTAMLLRYAKDSGVPVILIGHITKEGSIAGPKVLEHIVDVVLQFEGENRGSYRLLRGIKNRFGSTSELAVFEMTGAGLVEVTNPSQMLIPMHKEGLSGLAVSAMLDGNRPFLIEVQALASSAAYGTPQRSATGFDQRRLNMLLAVLERRAGFKLGQKDVFINMAGGLKVSDPACDMAVIVAVLSSNFDMPIDTDIAFAGEVGLSGEIRPVGQTDRRIAEAARLGFKKIFVSKYSATGDTANGRIPGTQATGSTHKGIEIIKVADVPDLVRNLFK